MPVNVDVADIKGPEGDRVRRLYAVPASAAPKPRRESFEKRSAPARGRMKARKQEYAKSQRNAGAGRSARKRSIGRALKIGGKAHRAIGSPGGVVAGMLSLFVGAGVVVAIIRNPAIFTVPMNFISGAIKAFTGLMSGPATTKTTQPIQNVAPKGA